MYTPKFKLGEVFLQYRDNKIKQGSSKKMPSSDPPINGKVYFY